MCTLSVSYGTNSKKQICADLICEHMSKDTGGFFGGPLPVLLLAIDDDNVTKI